MVTFLFGFIALVDTLVHPPRLFRGAGHFEDDVDDDDRPGRNRMQCHPRCDMMGRAPCGAYRCAYGMITENGRNTWHRACNGTGRQRCRNYAMGLCERAP